MGDNSGDENDTCDLPILFYSPRNKSITPKPVKKKSASNNYSEFRETLKQMGVVATVSEISDAINFAVHNGINFFDTADVYGMGLSEKILGEIVQVVEEWGEAIGGGEIEDELFTKIENKKWDLIDQITIITTEMYELNTKNLK